MNIKSFIEDFSVSAFAAGFTTVLVGVTSSIIIVFQAATALGANSAEIASWIWALGLTLGLSSIVLSLYYKIPLIAAWSTPGAAYLAINGHQATLNEAIGAFIISGILITTAGFSSLFKKIISHIPTTITSAMLAGILLPFCLKIIEMYSKNTSLIIAMTISYFLSKVFVPRYSILTTLTIGVFFTLYQGGLNNIPISFELTQPIFINPIFNLHSIWNIAIPLFIITMVSQNLVGVSIIKSFGYPCPTNQAVGITGFFNTIFAPFGAFSTNLAAISAALCLSPDVHEDKSKRYIASVIAGFFYVLVGILGATITSLLFLFPKEFVITLAGLALLSTLINSFLDAFSVKGEQEPAILTFLITISDIKIFGINSIILGLLFGMVLYFILRKKAAIYKKIKLRPF